MSVKAARKKSFGYRFAMIQRIELTLVRDGLARVGVTKAQLPFLMELFHEGRPMTQQELSQRLIIDPGATARNLDHLEKNGWIHREVNPENRRQKLVSPTTKALDHEARLVDILTRASEALAADLSESEKSEALAILDRIIETAMAAGKKKDA